MSCIAQAFHERLTTGLDRYFMSRLSTVIQESVRCLSAMPFEAPQYARVLISNVTSAAWLMKGVAIDLHVMSTETAVNLTLIHSVLKQLFSLSAPLEDGTSSFKDFLLVRLLSVYPIGNELDGLESCPLGDAQLKYGKGVIVVPCGVFPVLRTACKHLCFPVSQRQQ